MATVNEIFAYLDRRAPFRYQADFDNAGFLVGHGDRPVERVLVALDITPETIREAIEGGCQLIVAHHPVIWGQIGRVTDETTTGKNLLTLIENNIAAICAHTNLDAVEGGVNTALAAKLDLQDTVPLEEEGIDAQGVPCGIGRVGTIPGGPMPLSDFVARLKNALNLGGVRVLDAGVPVRKVAVGGGACGSMLPLVKALGCDTFVTSDLKHDLYLEARAQGINLLDAGHYSTETVVCPVLKTWLESGFPGLEVLLSQTQGEVFAYL